MKPSGPDRPDAKAAFRARLTPLGVGVPDLLVVFVFAVMALLHHTGRSGGAFPFVRFVYLHSDAANIASFAAAWDYPTLFQGDEVLADQRNFRIYSTVHIPVLRFLARVTGEYGTAFSSLLGLHVFVQALGFYVFGRVVFQSRYWALLLALVTLMPIELNLGEYWGIYDDPQPRFSFQAILPFLLAAAYCLRSRPRLYPWLLGAAGALIYVHPVSAGPWGLAIWLGLWVFQPSTWSFAKRVWCSVFLGAVFLAVTAPFVIHYLQNHSHGVPEGVPVSTAYEIMALRFDKGFLDLPRALRDFRSLWWRGEWLHWIWAVVGPLLVVIVWREAGRRLAVVGAWIGGLLITTVAIPFVEQKIARAYGLIPIEVDLVRGIRYLVPLMLLLCLWPLAETTRTNDGSSGNRFRTQTLRFSAYVVGASLVGLWVNWHPPDRMLDAVRCWSAGTMVCAGWPPEETSWRPELPVLVEALDAVRENTPPGARILTTAYASQVRYYSRRPVVYAWKDGGILAYTNHLELVRWYQRHLAVKDASREKDAAARLAALLTVGGTLNAEYLFVDFAPSGDPSNSIGGELVWANKSFALFKINRS